MLIHRFVYLPPVASQAEIHNLNRAIAAKREANDALQRRWLADQTALVNAANDAEAKASRLRDLTSHAVLLDQKRIRMDGAVETQVRTWLSHRVVRVVSNACDCRMTERRATPARGCNQDDAR